jgi:hypothetical protein
MTDAQKRTALKSMYPGSKFWGKRVDKMSETQVTAIYLKNIDKIQNHGSK